MRFWKRMAFVGAVASVLGGTMFAGSAQAATGGGCGSVKVGIQVCSTWVTGQGPANSTYVNSYTAGTLLHPQLFYCSASTVMTSGTCASHGLTLKAVSLTSQFTIHGTGLQGTWPYAQKPTHGIAYASTNVLYSAPPPQGINQNVTGSLVYW